MEKKVLYFFGVCFGPQIFSIGKIHFLRVDAKKLGFFTISGLHNVLNRT